MVIESDPNPGTLLAEGIGCICPTADFTGENLIVVDESVWLDLHCPVHADEEVG